MESFCGASVASISFTVKKKRSSECRRPCSDSQKLLQACTFLAPSTHFLGSESCEENYKCQESIALDGLRNERKQVKLKFKLGGVPHTLHAKSAANSPRCFDAPESGEKFSQDVNFSGASSMSRQSCHESVYDPSMHSNEPVRKSKRVPKRRIIDVELDEDYQDADKELSFLGSLNASKETWPGKVNPSDSGQMDDVIHGPRERPLKFSKQDRKKSRLSNLYEDEDYVGEQYASESDNDEGRYQRKKFGVEGKNEATTSMHNRSRQCSTNDVSLESGASLLEFPDGLPAASSKKQKAKLSEVEQQAKKAEAALRRRLQVEKAAKEAEAEAIKKILGQDSARKKKQEKIKQQLNKLAEAKAAKAETLGSNTVRWITSPTGTVVIFSNDIGLPSIFNSGSCSYPPPREKCAGPDCTNAYKYRDSKLRLPLCSLNCYKAIHGKVHSAITC